MENTKLQLHELALNGSKQTQEIKFNQKTDSQK